MIGLVPSFATRDEAAAFVAFTLRELDALIAAGGTDWPVVLGATGLTGPELVVSKELRLAGLTADFWDGLVAALDIVYPLRKPPATRAIDPAKLDVAKLQGFADATEQAGTASELRAAVGGKLKTRTSVWLPIMAIGGVVLVGFTAAAITMRREAAAKLHPARREV
jgi:hypothetical protein